VDGDSLARAIVTATRALSPDKVKVVRDMLGVKVTPRGMSNVEKTTWLEAKVREAKLARIKKSSSRRQLQRRRIRPLKPRTPPRTANSPSATKMMAQRPN